MKKKLSILLSAVLLLFCMMVPQFPAYAAAMGLSLSASSVNIGDTVTATISIPDGISANVSIVYDAGILSFTSASGTINGGDGQKQMTVGNYGASTDTARAAITFQAVSAGTVTISVSTNDAVDVTGGVVSLDGASASLTVANAAGGNVGTNENPPVDPPAEQPQTPPAEQPQDPPAAPLSADNSLARLTLSAGTLSPAFRYNVVNYTATVGHEVTDIVISAQVSNEKATIESMTGNENLKVGKNKIQIVVKAENGVRATYTITVTRLPEEETNPSAPGESESEPDSSAPEESESETETETETESGSVIPVSSFAGDGTFSVNGQDYATASEIPEDLIPEGFALSEIIFSETAFPALQSELLAGDFLLYLLPKREDGTVSEEDGIFAVYDTVRGMVYSYVTLTCEEDRILVTLPAMELIPEGYTESLYIWEGKGTFYVYQNDAELPQGFYLIYARNQMGEDGWYRFDSAYGTYQRYIKTETPVIEPPETDLSEELETLQKEKQQLSEQLAKAEKQKKGFLFGMAVLTVFLALAAGALVLVLIVKGKEIQKYGENSFDEENIDEDGIESYERSEQDNEEDGIEPYDESADDNEEDGIEPYDESADDNEKDGIEPYDESADDNEEDGIESYDQSEDDYKEDRIEQSILKVEDLKEESYKEVHMEKQGQNAEVQEEGETDEDLFNENDLAEINPGQIDKRSLEEEKIADQDVIIENEADDMDDGDLEFIDLDEL